MAVLGQGCLLSCTSLMFWGQLLLFLLADESSGALM